jgi:hypothetical protein
MPTASLDKKPEVSIDTVYQIQLPNGEFKKKYIKTVKTYGEGDEQAVDAVVLVDKDTPSNEGTVIENVSASLLVAPDIFPKFMFTPQVWAAKTKQDINALKVEASQVIDGYFAINPVTAYDLSQDADMVVNSIKEMLSGYFGPFMLGMLAHFIKSKIESRIKQSGGHIKPMPFERKLGTIKKELAERKANLALPENQRGTFNAAHPLGKPREVSQFGQP